MTLLRTYWDAAADVDPDVAERRRGAGDDLHHPRPRSAELWTGGGLERRTHRTHRGRAPTTTTSRTCGRRSRRAWDRPARTCSPSRPTGRRRCARRCAAGSAWATSRSGSRPARGWWSVGALSTPVDHSASHGTQCPRPVGLCARIGRDMAELHFFTGTMDSGKSTLALQTNHNHAQRGRVGRIFTAHDRAGEATLSSRLGLTHEAIEVTENFDFWRYVVTHLTQGGRIDYLDLRRGAVLLPGPGRPAGQDRRRAPARRLLLRHPHRLPQHPVPGQRPAGRAGRPDERAPGRGAVLVRQAGHPQRPHRGRRDGRRGRGDRRRRHRRRGRRRTRTAAWRRAPKHVAYEVLCRQHHRRRLTAERAHAVSLTAEPLPFG